MALLIAVVGVGECGKVGTVVVLEFAPETYFSNVT